MLNGRMKAIGFGAVGAVLAGILYAALFTRDKSPALAVAPVVPDQNEYLTVETWERTSEDLVLKQSGDDYFVVIDLPSGERYTANLEGSDYVTKLFEALRLPSEFRQETGHRLSDAQLLSALATQGWSLVSESAYAVDDNRQGRGEHEWGDTLKVRKEWRRHFTLRRPRH